MDNFRVTLEEFKVLGKELVDKVREIIHEGNVRRIIIRDEHGHTFIEIPLTVAAISVVAAPILAAVGAIAAHLAHFTIIVERVTPQPAPEPAPEPATEPPAPPDGPKA
jgi:Flp pilus assembly pilin Flp